MGVKPLQHPHRAAAQVSAQVVDEFMSPGGMEDAITSLVQLCLNKKFDGLVTSPRS